MTLRECARFLSERDGFLLVTHKNPDGDTLGSAAALCSALRRRGKTAWLFPNGETTKKFLPYVEPFFAPEGFEAACVVSVDVATDEMFAHGFAGQAELCIDHHPTNSHYAPKELIWADRAACGEIVLELVKILCGKLSKEEADLLYIAVSTDCGCFQYANTSARTLRAAAELLEAGADNRALNLRFFRRISRARMQLEGMIYSGMGFYHDGLVTVAIITRDMLRETGATEEDLDDLAGLAGKAENSILSITIRERPDGSSRVSARSNPEISSSELCAVFGGGGHAMAAGCTIQAPPEKAREMLLAVVDELMRVRGQA